MLFEYGSPASFRVREIAHHAVAAFSSRQASNSTTTTTSSIPPWSQHQQAVLMSQPPTNSSVAELIATVAVNTTAELLSSHNFTAAAQHPDFLHLAGLVCEAVLEVVFVALPGFLVAWTGMFDVRSQKFVAELNTMVFTPCLIFTKLASQLNADKLADLVVIPFIFIATTAVSWICAQAMARLFGFGRKKRQKNFILAMGVFGNSNSLPISLVLSLSQTIAGLHWDKVPGDNDNEVAARGILYLLIFQQLGQLLRWTWGYNVLLKPSKAYDEEEEEEARKRANAVEEGRYTDSPAPIAENDAQLHNGHNKKAIGGASDSGFSSGTASRSTSSSSLSTEGAQRQQPPTLIGATPANGNIVDNEPRYVVKNRAATEPIPNPNANSNAPGHITRFPSFLENPSTPETSEEQPKGWKAPFIRAGRAMTPPLKRASARTGQAFTSAFHRLPTSLQKTLSTIHHYHMSFWKGVWHQMNPPLWAMLAALIVASIPSLQHLFFTKGTLINNSFTRAVQTSGNVAVPLILVVLGANLARSTLPKDQIASTPEEKSEERRLLYASLLSRMVLPTLIMAPLLALIAKYVPVSILDDPIFVIVCFLLVGAPSALQLAQICQINEVFMGAMSNLLVASYVVAIFPSTLTLVLLALEVVEWAK